MSIDPLAEVRDLHALFEDWFQGRTAAEDDDFEPIAEALAEGFRLVTPAGRMLDRAELLANVHRARGSRVLELAVDDLEQRLLGADIYLVTYREWQREPGEPWTGRLSSALLGADPRGPRGWHWLHVHETWLPADSTPM